MLLKRVVFLVALTIGLIGVAACAAGTYGVWLLGARLDRVNDRVFVVIDTGLASAQNRVQGVQARLRRAEITAEQIKDDLRDWKTKKVEERLASRIEIESRAESLVGHLQTVGLWLDTSTDSIREVEQLLETAELIGVPADRATLDEILASLASLRGQLLKTEEVVQGVREIVAGRGSGFEEGRLTSVAKLLARGLLTMSEVDARLEDIVNRLSETQAGTERLKAKTSHYIAMTTGVSYLLVAWIAAGQVALALCGWKGCHRNRVPA